MKTISTLFAVAALLVLSASISSAAAAWAALANEASSPQVAQMQDSQGLKQRENEKAARPELREGQQQANPTGPASAGSGSMSRTPQVDSTTNGSEAIEGAKGQDRQNAVEQGKNPANVDH